MAATPWSDRLAGAVSRARKIAPEATNYRVVLRGDSFDAFAREVEPMATAQQVAARFSTSLTSCWWQGITVLRVDGAEVQYLEASRPPARDGAPERLPLVVIDLSKE